MSSRPFKPRSLRGGRPHFAGWREGKGGSHSKPPKGHSGADPGQHGLNEPSSLASSSQTISSSHSSHGLKVEQQTHRANQPSSHAGSPEKHSPKGTGGSTSHPVQQYATTDAAIDLAAEEAQMRRRARRNRGGRMGGGTRGWGYGDKGDSDEFDERESYRSEEPLPEEEPREEFQLTRPGVTWQYVWNSSGENAHSNFWGIVRRIYPVRSPSFRLMIVFSHDVPEEMEPQLTTWHDTLEEDDEIPVTEMRNAMEEVPQYWRLVPYFATINFHWNVGGPLSSPVPVNVPQPPLLSEDRDDPFEHMLPFGDAVHNIMEQVHPERPDIYLRDSTTARPIAGYNHDWTSYIVAQDILWNIIQPNISVVFATGTELIGMESAEDSTHKSHKAARSDEPVEASSAKASGSGTTASDTATNRQSTSPQKEAPPPQASPRSSAPTKRKRPSTKSQATQTVLICQAHFCHANLGLMTQIERDEHVHMHAIAQVDQQQADSMKKDCREKAAKIIGLQTTLRQLQEEHAQRSAELLAALQMLHESEIAEASSKAAEQGKVGSKADTKALSEAKSRSTDETLPEPADPAEATPTALPPSISIPLFLYDSKEFTAQNLKSLFKAGFRVCNVCLGWCKGYNDFSKHTESCNTSPWNFVTSTDKKNLPHGKTYFAHRFPKLHDTSKDKGKEDTPDNNKPGHKKRKRKESQSEYKEIGNDEGEDSDELTSGPDPRPRKKR